MISTFEIRSLSELPDLAGVFVHKFPEGGIFLIDGEMGAGKTTFIRTVCEALGAMGAASPTFSLINEYTTKSGVPVYHMDLYRLKNLSEALDIGIEEYTDRPGYIFIEWPDIVRSLFGEEANPVEIKTEGDKRIFRF